MLGFLVLLWLALQYQIFQWQPTAVLFFLFITQMKQPLQSLLNQHVEKRIWSRSNQVTQLQCSVKASENLFTNLKKKKVQLPCDTGFPLHLTLIPIFNKAIEQSICNYVPYFTHTNLCTTKVLVPSTASLEWLQVLPNCQLAQIWSTWCYSKVTFLQKLHEQQACLVQLEAAHGTT